MVIPADPEEMKEFQARCVAQSQCVVDITFPVAFILLPSKEAFQSIYNRHKLLLFFNSYSALQNGYYFSCKEQK